MDSFGQYLKSARKATVKRSERALAVVAPAPAPLALAGRKELRKAPLEFSSEERALRDEKIQFIQLCTQEKQRGAAWPDAALTVAARDAVLLPRLAKKGLLTYDNLRKWREVLGRTRDGSPDWANRDALLRNYGRNSERPGDGAFWVAVMACFLNTQHPKLAKIYRKFAARWRERYPDRAIPSLSAIRYYIDKTFPRRMLALARDGENAYQQHYRDYIERDPETIRPNECWVADNRTLDFFIRVSDGKGGWVAVRPWVCLILDVKSEFVISCQLGVDAVTNAVIRNGLADGISKYGRPSVFLIDNGKDFTAQGFTTPVFFTPKVHQSETYTHSIMQELDIEVRKALPYNAQSKVVERFFREMMEYDAFARGYVGNTPANRPATADVWSGNPELLLSVQQAAEAVDEFIRGYHLTPNQGKYCNGLPPAQAFAPDLRLNRPAMTPEEYYLAFLKPLATSRIVDPRGPSVVVGRQRFVAVNTKALWPYDGKPVMVKFDSLDAKHCFAYSLEGRLLTECRAPEFRPYFARTDEERAQLSEDLRRRAGERKALKALIMHETHGFHKLDPATIFRLDASTLEGEARLRLIDRRNSVRGESHSPAIYALPGELPPPVPELPAPAAALPALPPPEPGPRVDQDRLKKLSQLLKKS